MTPEAVKDLELVERKVKGLGVPARALVGGRLAWLEKARPKQLRPLKPDGWRHWLLMPGRGFGKTRTGAEDTWYEAAVHPGQFFGVIGPTQSDVRKLCFEGESGLEAVCPPELIKRYSSQTLEMELTNGSVIYGLSAEKPDRIRGYNFHGTWCDELASWGASNARQPSQEAHRLQDTWDNMLLALRKGAAPRVVITTTPRPLPFLRKLAKDTKTALVTGSSYENRANLADTFIETLTDVFEGTKKGRQEVHGEILDDAEGALWKRDQLEKCRVRKIPDDVEIVRWVIAIDPAVTTEDDSDETGMILAGLGDNGHVYVAEDISGHYSPNTWAKLALSLYERVQADCIVGETNQGGDLVEANLQAHAEGVFFSFKKVHAKRGKYLRAEPVAAFYEKGKVHNVGMHIELENQMVNFVGSTGNKSPDRLDALVYAVGELMLGTVKHDFW